MQHRAPRFYALLQLKRGDEVIFEGEIEPGDGVNLPPDGLRLEVLWIRKHHEPADHDQP